MKLANWLGGIFRAEAEDAADTKPVSGYSLVDTGAEVKLDSPTPTDKPVDEPAGDDEQVPEEPAEEEGEVEPAEETPPSDDISDDLLARAAALGLEFEDIRHFRKDSTLKAELDRVERIQQRFAARKPAEAPAQDAKKPDLAARITKQRDKINQMVTDGYDENQVEVARDNLEMLETLWAAQQEQEQKYSDLQEMTERQQQAAQAKAAAEAEANFEENLEKLGDEYKVLFGEGPGTKMKQNSAEFQNRARVFQTMYDLAEMYQKRGRAIPPDAELLKKAVAAEFNEQNLKLAREKLKTDLKKAGEQTIARTKPAGNRPLEGEDAALAKTRDFLKQNAG